jgi:hypothetical protein
MLKTLFFSGSLIMLTFACLPAKGTTVTAIYASNVPSLNSNLSEGSEQDSVNLTSPAVFFLGIMGGIYFLTHLTHHNSHALTGQTIDSAMLSASNGFDDLSLISDVNNSHALAEQTIDSAMSAPNEFAIGDFSATSGGNTAISNISILSNLDVPEPSQYLGGFLALGLAGIVRKKGK